MAQQEDGWPLGLHPLNVRVGLVRNRDVNGSLSFNTLLTRSPSSSTDSSSDLDTEAGACLLKVEVHLLLLGLHGLLAFIQSFFLFPFGDFESTGSFFRDKSITLGSLIGISNILELSRRSTRGRVAEPTIREKKCYKSRTWLFSLCSRLGTDAVSMNNTPSLGHFLQAERQAANVYRRNQSPSIFGPDDFSNTLPASDHNSLFVEGHVAPPQSSSCSGQDSESVLKGGLVEDNDYGTPLMFSCLCGNLTQ